jgi:hypothetical protein
MIQVSTGGMEAFNYLVYGDDHPGTISYIEQQFSAVSNTLTDAGRAFMSSARERFESFHGSEAVRKGKAALRRTKMLFSPNTIRALTDISQLQEAPKVMQRYLMANKYARRKYFDQEIDGYSDSYVDLYPGQIGEDHYDYRRVMDGVVEDLVVSEGEEGPDWKITHYVEDLVEGDRDLTCEEVSDIKNHAWNAIEIALREGAEDPSSIYRNKL